MNAGILISMVLFQKYIFLLKNYVLPIDVMHNLCRILIKLRFTKAACKSKILFHLYIPRQGVEIFFLDYYNDFMKLSDLELENANVSAKKTGLFGAHQQGLRLLALYKASNDKGVTSSIKVEGNSLISFV